MIIPFTINKDIKVGDTVVLLKDIQTRYCCITAGHEFLVIGFSMLNINLYTLKDLENNHIFQLNSSDITLKIGLKEAEKEYVYRNDKDIYLRFIKNFCPNTGYEYDNYEKHDSCKVGLAYYRFHPCVPSLDCAKYLKFEQIHKCPELLKHLRLNKLKKLK